MRKEQSGDSNKIDLDLFYERFRRRYILKKKVNAVLCLFISFCGVTAVLYSVFFNHKNLFDRLRYLTFNGTIFTAVISFIFAIVSIVEAVNDTEVTLRPVYFLRLSSAVTEVVIFVVIMIGLTPLFPDKPDITSYTGVMMHLVVPPATILSFSFNDPPIGKLKPLEPVFGTWFITIYAVVMTTLLATGTLASEQAPYSFLDIEHTNPFFTLFCLLGIYVIGYFVALFLSFANRKLSWLWYYDVRRLRNWR